MNKSSLAGLSVLVLASVFSIRFAMADLQKEIVDQASAYYKEGKFTEAIEKLTPIVKENKEWEPGHRIMGLCYLGLKNYAMAEEQFSQAEGLKSQAYQTYYGLGQARCFQKKYDSCITALTTALRLSEKESDKLKASIYELRGKAFYQTKKYDDAVEDLTKAVRVNQSDGATFKMLGFSCLNQNRIDEALQALEKAHSMNSGDASINEALGKAYLKKGADALQNKDYAEAERLLLKAKGYNPKDGYVYYNLGEVYKFQKNYTEAEKELTQALAILPQSAEVYRDLGFIYEMQKKWDPALTAYKKAEEIKSEQWVQDAIKRVTENKK
jgi:tetratricopeptide (TPR) repeat protein